MHGALRQRQACSLAKNVRSPSSFIHSKWLMIESFRRAHTPKYPLLSGPPIPTTTPIPPSRPLCVDPCTYLTLLFRPCPDEGDMCQLCRLVTDPSDPSTPLTHPPTHPNPIRPSQNWSPPPTHRGWKPHSRNLAAKLISSGIKADVEHIFFGSVDAAWWHGLICLTSIRKVIIFSTPQSHKSQRTSSSITNES